MEESSARLKWIVSSRNKTRIEQLLAEASGMVCLDLEENTDPISEAIQVYIDWKVSNINLLRKNRVSREKVSKILHTKADGTFLWVALVIQELLEVEVSSEILVVLEDCPAGLDQIYERMLKQISEHKRNGPEMCRRILSTAVFAYRPLHLHELHVLSGLEKYNSKVNDINETVLLCRSFLTVREDHVYLIHQSAKDFLTGTSPKNTFRCDPEKIHDDLFRRSIKVMGGVLKRDVYDLILPGITIDEVSPPDPNPLKEVKYSCVYWINHYCDSNRDDVCTAAQNTTTSSDVIVQFLQEFLLNWFEALSLLHCLDDGVRSIRMLEQFLVNKWMIEKAPLQTYVSALLFSPSESRIREIFRNEEPNWIGIKPRVENKWSRCLQTLQGLGPEVHTIAFSCDSRLMASGSERSTVCVWDPETGSELPKLTGHKWAILSVAFSYHEANLLASGCQYGSIRLWDLETGTELKRLEDHDAWVHSVAFSPRNPNILASGGSDKTVRLWDLKTLQIRRLRGHEDSIRSVGFSNHNMNLLASGSDDGSVRVWDLDKGSTLHVLKGHSRWVNSVAFSDISKVLASASGDKTIRLWDSETGSALRILQGHSRDVRAIAFSDNSHILASGSTDTTMRLWDTETGLELQKLEGNGDMIEAVAFYNSKVLASASSNGTARFWDLEPASEPASEPEKSARIEVTEFSHDAKILASGSYDGTIRLWDPNTGSVLRELFGHRNDILSVTFSCDSKLLASTCRDRTVRVWDPETGLKRFNNHNLGSGERLKATNFIWKWNIA
ncbi:unnamed protein product [Clonostachys byssicola]|uniref:Vegetative incompatibility protein HET-E-1 n=1 Tax=Clonostachys byssicola TaxID=160290 RepID=A0A9N9UVD6_9HYPO|nr:unnamed protein product [Clonostachys byssicola]